MRSELQYFRSEKLTEIGGMGRPPPHIVRTRDALDYRGLRELDRTEPSANSC